MKQNFDKIAAVIKHAETLQATVSDARAYLTVYGNAAESGMLLRVVSDVIVNLRAIVTDPEADNSAD